MAVFPISGDVEVVRIPELPLETNLANDDRIPIWHASNNVTEGVSLATLRAFIETGTGGTLDPIYSGGSILYIVPPSAEGLDYFSYPAIASYDFKLRRDGYPMKPVTEFLRLDAGGFKLIGTTLVEGQRYELDIFELYNGAIPAPSGTGSSGFIAGNKIVNTNEVISVSDLNKVFQVRGGSTALTITLPDVAMCPENSFVIIETLINNTKQHKINTTAGQYMYLNNEAKSEQHIGKGEYIWLYRTDDGWYIIVDKGNFSNLGVPVAAYKAGLNQVECEGQSLLKSDYPRLWAFIQTLGSSLVTDGVWNTASVVQAGRTVAFPYRGCFADVDATHFRMPDFRGMSVRGLLNVGGVDAERNFNNPGGYQRHEFASHQHDLGHWTNDSGGGSQQNTFYLNNDNGPTAQIGHLVNASGGAESRMDNIGLLWFMNY